MRITHNDRLFNVYTLSSNAFDSEGYPIDTWTKLEGMPADMQPIGGTALLQEYGINSNPAEVRKLFFDLGYNVPIGGIVEDDTGKKYMVKGLHIWYGHQKAIMEPYTATITLAGD